MAGFTVIRQSPAKIVRLGTVKGGAKPLTVKGSNDVAMPTRKHGRKK